MGGSAGAATARHLRGATSGLGRTFGWEGHVFEDASCFDPAVQVKQELPNLQAFAAMCSALFCKLAWLFEALGKCGNGDSCRRFGRIASPSKAMRTQDDPG